MNKKSFDCFDTEGGKIRRAGVASIKRVLRNLFCFTSRGENVYALVSCPDAGVYIARYEKVYVITHISEVGDTLLEQEAPRDECIKTFFRIREEAMSEPDE